MNKKCIECKHESKSVYDEPCYECIYNGGENDMFESNKQTNADRIRAMNDEELAEFLYGIDHYWSDSERIVRFGDESMHDSKEDILDWLQEEVE
jgi:hypothetical protein